MNICSMYLNRFFRCINSYDNFNIILSLWTILAVRNRSFDHVGAIGGQLCYMCNYYTIMRIKMHFWVQIQRNRKFYFSTIYFSFFFKCYSHAWYLSVDMQVFVLSPFVVYLIHRFELKAIIGWWWLFSVA